MASTPYDQSVARAGVSTAGASTLGPRVLELLTRLARPGARLRAVPGGIAVEQRRDKKSASELPLIPAGVIDAARAAGCLMAVAAPRRTIDGKASGGTSEVLSTAGRAAVRSALLAQQQARSGQQQRSASKVSGERGQKRGASALDATGGHRSVERMALVEQLGIRRDARGKPLLSSVAVAAALRLAQDFAMAQMQPRVTARWSAAAIPEPRRRSAPGAGVEVAEATAAAQARVRSALAFLGGVQADIVLDVCCFERGLESIEAMRNWPKHSGRVVLGIALVQLATHYGMIVPPRAGIAAMRAWGDDGYRPSAEVWLKRS